MSQVEDDPGSLTLRKEVSFVPRAGGGIVLIAEKWWLYYRDGGEVVPALHSECGVVN